MIIAYLRYRNHPGAGRRTKRLPFYVAIYPRELAEFEMLPNESAWFVPGTIDPTK